MKATIKDKKEVAKGTLRVEFAVDPQESHFQAGQHADFILINPPETDAEGNSRIFSLVNSPNEKGVLAITTRLRDTAFKRVLKDLPVGAQIEIEAVRGVFMLPDKPGKPLVFIAGGIGITPFMSMLKFVAEEYSPFQITLLYSNRDREGTAYFEELKRLAEENSNIKVIFTMTQDPGWTGEKRHIDERLIKDYFGSEPSANIYYIAGPPAMVKAIYKVLTHVGVSSSQIEIENFDGY